MKKMLLKKYAQLIANVGANVRDGQDVIIYAGLDQPEFVKYVVEQCYKAGARKVVVEWNYDVLRKIHVKYRDLETLSEVENWEIERLKRYTEVLPAVIHLLSEDPDGQKGIDQNKNARSMQARLKILKPIRDEMENKYQWCIAAVPGSAWAKKIFPNETKSKAVEKLWEAILYTSRVWDDPIKEWQEHNRNLSERCRYLNNLGLKFLEYKSSNGTDLRVGLIEDSKFLGGGEYTIGGNFYNPNIPTEEVFISPKRGSAEGIVFSTKPLSYNGELIENFSVKFKDGCAVEVKAEKNEELLKKLISMDEGAAYLGECALIPYDSPINKTGLLFYNTLFDENASCHLALGMGFSNCIVDYEKYTLEQCREKGINDSIVHEDFMIGSADLDIVGVTGDGKRIQIFKEGNWAF